jgi:hypothetical protein
MPQLKMGGKSPLQIFLKGNRDLRDTLLSTREGGQGAARGLRDLVRETYREAFDVEIMHEPCPGCLRLAEAGSSCPSSPSLDTRLVEAAPDVAVFSLQPEIAPGPGKPSSLRDLPSPGEFKEHFMRIVRAIKARLGAHVIVFNCSPLDPEERVHNYCGREDTLPVRVHRFNLALLELSVLEGISVIDVDRIIGELGGEQHVLEALRYSPAAHQALAQEFLRVLEDIGFFEERPLMPQVGCRAKT